MSSYLGSFPFLLPLAWYRMFHPNSTDVWPPYPTHGPCQLSIKTNGLVFEKDVAKVLFCDTLTTVRFAKENVKQASIW